MFQARFTNQELNTILEAAHANVEVWKIWSEFTTSERIRSDWPTLAPGIQQLVTAGILTQERADQILDTAI